LYTRRNIYSIVVVVSLVASLSYHLNKQKNTHLGYGNDTTLTVEYSVGIVKSDSDQSSLKTTCTTSGSGDFGCSQLR
jgi:hypothetical protein